MQTIRDQLSFAVKFVGKMLIGTALFAAIMVVVFNLNLMLHYWKERGVDDLFISFLSYVEYLLAFGDLGIFSLWFLSEMSWGLSEGAYELKQTFRAIGNRWRQQPPNGEGHGS